MDDPSHVKIIPTFNTSSDTSMLDTGCQMLSDCHGSTHQPATGPFQIRDSAVGIAIMVQLISDNHLTSVQLGRLGPFFFCRPSYVGFLRALFTCDRKVCSILSIVYVVTDLFLLMDHVEWLNVTR